MPKGDYTRRDIDRDNINNKLSACYQNIFSHLCVKKYQNIQNHRMGLNVWLRIWSYVLRKHFLRDFLVILKRILSTIKIFFQEISMKYFFSTTCIVMYAAGSNLQSHHSVLPVSLNRQKYYIHYFHVSVNIYLLIFLKFDFTGLKTL